VLKNPGFETGGKVTKPSKATETESTTKNTKSAKNKPDSLSVSSALSVLKNPGLDIGYSGRKFLRRYSSAPRRSSSARSNCCRPAGLSFGTSHSSSNRSTRSQAGRRDGASRYAGQLGGWPEIRTARTE